MLNVSESAMANLDAASSFRDAETVLWEGNGLAPEERWVDVREPTTRIRLQDVGSGDPILFIGGTGGTGAFWAPLIRELRGRRAIVVDRPGWGLSTPVDYRADTYGSVADHVIAAVLDDLGLDRVDIVGGSIGAIWALHAARRHPERVRRLVLMGGMPNAEVPLPRFIKLLRSPVGALMVRLPMREGMVRKQLAALGHGASLERGAMDDYIAWRLAFQAATPSMRHERDMVRAITTSSGFQPGVTLGPDELAYVSQPTLMLFGSQDPTGSEAIWRGFVAMLPDGTFHLVPDAGHNPFWDRPEEVGARLRQFLEGVQE